MIQMKTFRAFHGDDFAPCRAHRDPRSTFYSRILSISFLTLSTIVVQPSKAEAQSFFERRFQQRLEQLIERRRRDEAKMSDSQKEQLFETRRRWMASTYEKRLALLQAGQNCIQKATSFADGEDCRTQQQRAWRDYFEQSRQTINTERERLGLSPLRSALMLGF